MPQSTAIEVVTVLKTVGRHGYSKFAKSIKVLGEGKTLIRSRRMGKVGLGRVHMATSHVKRAIGFVIKETGDARCRPGSRPLTRNVTRSMADQRGE